MVKFYVNRINNGKMTLDQVPQRWRAEVETELAKQ